MPQGKRNPLHSRLAERLAEARERKGATLRDLAVATELSKDTIQRIEAGKHVAALDTLERLAAALDVSPAWLAYGLGPMEPPTLRRRRKVAMLADALEASATPEELRQAASLLRRAYGLPEAPTARSSRSS